MRFFPFSFKNLEILTGFQKPCGPVWIYHWSRVLEYQFHHQFPPFRCQFQQDSRFRFDGCQLEGRKMKLFQPKLKFEKKSERDNTKR